MAGFFRPRSPGTVACRGPCGSLGEGLAAFGCCCLFFFKEKHTRSPNLSTHPERGGWGATVGWVGRGERARQK